MYQLFHDYPNEPIGGDNPYWMCSHCGISDPQINGHLMNHAEHCQYRKEKITELQQTRRQQAYDRKETYTVEEVLPFIVLDKRDEGFKRDYDGDLIKMNSHRYHCFENSGCECVSCGIEGTFFAKERSVDKHGKPTGPTFHFNLYAIDDEGNEILMTKDHIQPKAKGGKDHINNYQTMCTICNWLKADL